MPPSQPANRRLACLVPARESNLLILLAFATVNYYLLKNPPKKDKEMFLLFQGNIGFFEIMILIIKQQHIYENSFGVLKQIVARGLPCVGAGIHEKAFWGV